LAHGMHRCRVVSTENPFRTPYSPASLELHCPHCERNLYLAPPEAAVSLTACPHLDCQRVALVCSGEALGHDLLGWKIGDQSVALTFERFVETRRRILLPDATDILLMLVGFIIYILTPMTMWAYAWRDVNLLLVVVVLTGPAVGIGLCALLAIVLDVRRARRDRRRLADVRREAFARARWQVARVRPR
jgi:hypothetical protein